MDCRGITAVRQQLGNVESQHIEVVRVGASIFHADEIIAWIPKGEHRFWMSAQARKVDVVIRQHAASQRYYLTVEGGGFPGSPTIASSHLNSWGRLIGREAFRFSK